MTKKNWEHKLIKKKKKKREGDRERERTLRVIAFNKNRCNQQKYSVKIIAHSQSVTILIYSCQIIDYFSFTNFATCNHLLRHPLTGWEWGGGGDLNCNYFQCFISDFV